MVNWWLYRSKLLNAKESYCGRFEFVQFSPTKPHVGVETVARGTRNA